MDIQDGHRLRGQNQSAPAISDGWVYLSHHEGALFAVDIQSGQDKWKVQTGGDIFSDGHSPAISDGVVYFGSPDGRLYAFDSRSGAEKWSFRRAAPLAAPRQPRDEWSMSLARTAIRMRSPRRESRGRRTV